MNEKGANRQNSISILLVTTISGFLPKFLMQDVRLLQERGFIVHYASNFEHPVYACDREALEREGIICHPVPIAKSPAAIRENAAAFRELRSIVRREGIRAVLCHNPMGGVLGRLLTLENRGLYVIYTAHGFHFYQGAPLLNWLLFYPAERLLAHRTDQLVTINAEDRARAERFRLHVGGAVSQIPGVGLDIGRFRPISEMRAEMRARMKIAPEDYLFLSVGELNRNKNHKTIIRAFGQLPDRVHLRLAICGEGQERPALERLIAETGLTEQVQLWGYQEHIERFYQAADCFLFPSRREGLGMAALEAMACGLPLIVADNRGTREYTRGGNAMVCEASDTRGFAAAMRRMAEHPDEGRIMGERSVIYSRRFTLHQTEMVMRRVYQRMEDTLYEKA